ncbi:MAG: SxtJ family membrane protein [Candidatus Omnitrophota bacterium]
MKGNLKKIWQGWKKIAHKIGDFQARVILTILYFVLITPIALFMMFFDPLRIKRRYVEWIIRPQDNAKVDLLEKAKGQF